MAVDGPSAVPAPHHHTPLRVARTTVDHATQPLGIDTARPRLGWIAEADGHTAHQRAYRILVARRPEDLTPTRADVWDTGRVDSERCGDIPYRGPELTPRTAYHWQVRLWDSEDRPSLWSTPATWETGMLGTPWNAEWIGAPEQLTQQQQPTHPQPSDEQPHPDPEPAPLLRREFTLPARPVRARLYLSGLGHHRIRLNGAPVTDAALDPAFTDYRETVLYAVHDITGQLLPGGNALGVELGRGFFGMTTPNVWNWHRAPWHGRPRLILRLEAELADGSRTVIVSDSTWRTTDGPTRSDSLYAGETYDARRAHPGWTTPGHDDTDWAPAVQLPAPAGRLTAQQHQPVRITGTVEPVSITHLGGTRYVADLGRTIAGWTRLTTEDLPAGTRVTLQYGEQLNPDGTVQAITEHIGGGRFQRDEYLAPDPADRPAADPAADPDTWESRFTYKGFRHIQLDGLPQPPRADRISGRLAHTDVPRTGTFACSDERYEQLERAMRNTVLNNLHGIPTDTPMFEKNGWTGDVQVSAPTMAFAFDMSRFFRKWLDDLADSQQADGQLPVIVPSAGWGFTDLAPTPEWTTVYPYLLRELHRWYGDLGPAEQHWPAATRYLDWELARRDAEGLAPTALGDWLAPGRPEGIPPEDPRLTATAYLHRALTGIAELGELLGRSAESDRYRKAAEECRTALNTTYLDSTAGHYRTARDPDYRQTSNAVPLAFDLVPTEHAEQVAANLAADIAARGHHLNTGCLGTGLLLPVLSRYGHPDTARALAAQTGYPSWGYWLDRGADTMWEMWERTSRSRNHHFLGTVAQWFYENVAGLRPGEDGYRHFTVRPDGRSGLTWARAELSTVRGKAAAGWTERPGRGLRLTVDVPVGSTAEVHVPTPRQQAVAVTPSVPSGPVPLGNDRGFAVFAAPHGHWEFSTD